MTDSRVPPAVLRSPKLRGLTSLRGVAVLLVFLFHLIALPQLGHIYPYLYKVGIVGNLGVSFFFILSGFVLTWAWDSHRAVLRFFRRRVARIYPLYLLALLVGYFVARYDGGPNGLRSTLLAVLLLQAWVPRFNTYFVNNSVTWSLSVEAFFYLLFPLLVLLVGRSRVWLQRVTLAGAACATVAIGVAAHLHWMGQTSPPGVGVPPGFWAVTVLPLARLPEFVVGICVALEVRRGTWPRSPWWLSILFAAAAFAAASHLYRMDSPHYYRVTVAAITVLPFANLIATTAATELRGLRMPLDLAPLVWLGERSYALFLTHTFFVRIFSKAFLGHELFSVPAATVSALGLLGASVLTAHLLYAYIERPAERWLSGPGIS